MESHRGDLLVGLGKCPSSNQLGICPVHAAHKGLSVSLLSGVRKCRQTPQLPCLQLLPLQVQPFYSEAITRQIRPQSKHQSCLIKHRECKNMILNSLVHEQPMNF